MTLERRIPCAIIAAVVCTAFAVSVLAVSALVLSGCGGDAPTPAVAIARLASPTSGRAALPETWREGLTRVPPGRPVLLSCLDTDGDLVLTGDDDARFDGLSLPLDPPKSCTDARTHADFYADDTRVDCGTGRRALLLIVVGGGGTDLVQASEGESIGLIPVLNDARARIEQAGGEVRIMLAAPAMFGGLPAQGAMEEYLAGEVARRLDEAPCLVAAIVGHSHGGVTVTAVTAALEDRFPDRLYGVLVDRSGVLYDGDQDAIPLTAPILNVYQLNEGWHGVLIDQANVTNVEKSELYAPLAPSDGGSGLARVSHKTLDDATEVQGLIADAVVEFASR